MLFNALLLLPLILGCAERGSKAASSSRSDSDGDGYSAELDDCDDDDGAVHPGADDYCDGIDNDCNGLDGASMDQYDWYPDDDGDGHGDQDAAATLGCQAPDTTTSWVPDDNSDCDDSNNEVSPDGTELCNGLDDDCDGATDEDVTAENGAVEVWPDGDGDGQGDMTAEPVLLCAETPDYVTNSDDCDDEDAAIYVGATELCSTVFDDNCDGRMNDETSEDAELWCVDNDKDGFSPSGDVGYLACEPEEVGDILCATDRDWDDDDESVYPGAREYCDDKDNDQDGAADEEPSVNPTTWYRDDDKDGHGSEAPEDAKQACDQPDGHLYTSTDCDDDQYRRHNDHAELCGDNVDNDCDTSTDDTTGCTDYNVSSATEWFAGDVNLDGREDVILYLCSSDHVQDVLDCAGGADTGTTTSDCWLVGYSKSSGNEFHHYNIWSESAGKDSDQRWVVDVDNDRAVDLVWVEDSNGDGDNEWRVALADQRSQTFLTQSVDWMRESQTRSSATEHRLMGDVNGDGLADIVYVDGANVYASLGTGTSFVAFANWGDWSTISTPKYDDPDKFMLADVTGDNQDDLIVFFWDEDSANLNPSGADIDGAWLVMTSNGGKFSAPSWWLGVGDACQSPADSDKDLDGCGDWADDVFVADYTGLSDGLYTADAIGFYEKDNDTRDGMPNEGTANGYFFAGRSLVTTKTSTTKNAFNDNYENNSIYKTNAFGLCSVESTFVAEGSASDINHQRRAIFFADVNNDQHADALSFRSDRWEVALGGGTNSDLQAYTDWGPKNP